MCGTGHGYRAMPPCVALDLGKDPHRGLLCAESGSRSVPALAAGNAVGTRGDVMCCEEH